MDTEVNRKQNQNDLRVPKGVFLFELKSAFLFAPNKKNLASLSLL